LREREADQKENAAERPPYTPSKLALHIVVPSAIKSVARTFHTAAVTVRMRLRSRSFINF
jgi:hypothetical protein